MLRLQSMLCDENQRERLLKAPSRVRMRLSRRQSAAERTPLSYAFAAQVDPRRKFERGIVIGFDEQEAVL